MLNLQSLYLDGLAKNGYYHPHDLSQSDPLGSPSSLLVDNRLKVAM
jgi:hypothetical protein